RTPAIGHDLCRRYTPLRGGRDVGSEGNGQGRRVAREDFGTRALVADGDGLWFVEDDATDFVHDLNCQNVDLRADAGGDHIEGEGIGYGAVLGASGPAAEWLGSLHPHPRQRRVSRGSRPRHGSTRLFSGRWLYGRLLGVLRRGQDAGEVGRRAV